MKLLCLLVFVISNQTCLLRNWGQLFLLEQEIQDPLPTLRVDPHRLQQVLMNLLHNAYKFTEKGRIILKCWSENNRVYFAVHDTGIAEGQPHLVAPAHACSRMRGACQSRVQPHEARHGRRVAQTSKENVPHVHADGAVCDAIRRSNCECCKVWNSNHGHARDFPVAPQYRTAKRTSRTSMAAERIAHALASVASSGPSPPYSSCACPACKPPRRSTTHDAVGAPCAGSMRASDHTLHPSGKWGQAFRLESASIIWGKKSCITSPRGGVSQGLSAANAAAAEEEAATAAAAHTSHRSDSSRATEMSSFVLQAAQAREQGCE